MKPIKQGYKLWVQANIDGYISKFDVHQGKTGVRHLPWTIWMEIWRASCTNQDK